MNISSIETITRPMTPKELIDKLMKSENPHAEIRVRITDGENVKFGTVKGTFEQSMFGELVLEVEVG